MVRLIVGSLKRFLLIKGVYRNMSFGLLMELGNTRGNHEKVYICIAYLDRASHREWVDHLSRTQHTLFGVYPTCFNHIQTSYGFSFGLISWICNCLELRNSITSIPNLLVCNCLDHVTTEFFYSSELQAILWWMQLYLLVLNYIPTLCTLSKFLRSSCHFQS